MRDMASPGAPTDRYFLERTENENSTEFAHFGYPGFPNEAGIAWINMVKGLSNFHDSFCRTKPRFFGKS